MDWGAQFATALKGTSQVLSDAKSLTQSYQSLRNQVSSATLGLVNLPSVPTKLNQIFSLGNNVNTILSVLGLTNNGVASAGSNTQTSSTDVETGAFKWVEMETTPDSFATADSTLIFAGDPIYANMQIGAELVPIGLCQGFNFSTGINVTTFKELRCEENIVVPGKSMPGNLSLSRLCGAYSNLVNRLHISSGWNYSAHSADFKSLFGLMVMFRNPSRSTAISTLYFERCAINSINMGVQASGFQIADNVGITFGRIIGIGDLTTLSNSTSSSDYTVTVGDTTVKASDITGTSIKSSQSSNSGINYEYTDVNSNWTLGNTNTSTTYTPTSYTYSSSSDTTWER